MSGDEKPAGIVSLSTSDSGILRSLAQGEGSSVDSNIDLVHDSNQPSIKQPKAKAIAKATDDSHSRSGSSSPLLKPMSPSVKKPGDSSPESKKSIATPKTAKPMEQKKPKSSNRVLLVVVALVVLALFAVILIAALR